MPRHFPARGARAALHSFVVFLSIWLAASSPASAETWPTTDFEVFIGSPSDSSSVFLNDIIRTLDDYQFTDPDFRSDTSNPVADSELREIERHLGESARMLQSLGFKAPQLEPVITREDGSRAYRVYLFDMRDREGRIAGDVAKYAFDCSGAKRPVILLNASGIFADGKLADKVYQDLPHELFHAVQRSYPLVRDNCFLGDWIVEGTAQAIGADIAAWGSLRKSYPNRLGTWMRDRWGRRAYDLSLWIPDDSDASLQNFYEKDAAYGTSSFWRYLGEHAATAGAAGTLTVKPDYRYLHDFLNSKLPGPPGEAAEYEWLESMLRTHPEFKTSLSRIYPRFINTFAAFVPARVNPKAGFPVDVQDKWLQILFPMDKCPVVKLAGAKAVHNGVLRLPPNAAGCFRLDLGYNKPVDVHVTLSGVTKDELRAISVGTAGGQVISKPWVKTYGGRDSGSWILNLSELPAPGEALPLLVFSNVRHAPESNSFIEANIEIVTAAIDHTMLPAKAKAPAPAKSAGNDKGNNDNGGQLITTQSQVQRVGAQIDAGLDDMNPNLAHGSTVHLNPKQTPCKDAFVAAPCGPTTSITLSVMPGIIGSTMQSTGRGGVFGQYMSMLSGIADVGALEASDRMRKAYEKMNAVDGAEVSITIPLIDYGFSGHFSNAQITVNKAGGDNYLAMGPADIQPGPGHLFPLSGSVSIETFTPELLQGTFSADLVDPDDIESLGDDAALPVKHQISGRFQIVAPWALDDRILREPAQEAPGDAVAADVADFFPGVNMETGETVASKGAAQAGQSQGSGGSLPGCFCSCNLVEDFSQACQAVCEPVVRTCKGEQATAQTLADLAFKPKRVDAAQEKAAGEPYLFSLPEASVVFNELDAAKMLESDGVKVRAQDWFPEVLSRVNWMSTETAGHQVTLDMRFQGLDTFDSRTLSQEDFEMAALGFRLMEVKSKKALTKLGAKAFRADMGDSSELHVLTGIYGKAHDSDDFGTELVISLQLVNPEQTPMMRYVRMRGFIKPVIDQLRELALSSHEAEVWVSPQSGQAP